MWISYKFSWNSPGSQSKDRISYKRPKTEIHANEISVYFCLWSLILWRILPTVCTARINVEVSCIMGTECIRTLLMILTVRGDCSVELNYSVTSWNKEAICFLGARNLVSYISGFKGLREEIRNRGWKIVSSKFHTGKAWKLSIRTFERTVALYFPYTFLQTCKEVHMRCI